MPICGICAEQNPARARFCSGCGTALAAEAPSQEYRRTVTVVFCDMVGSTALGERLDSESLREVMSRYFAAMRAPLELHGGTIEKYIGDAVMAVFGLPVAHEDDALRATRAALEMSEALGPLNEELEAALGVTVSNRIGVFTGEVTAGDATTGQRLVTGDVVNVAARLEQAAEAGQVLIGEPTYRLVRGAVTAEPVEPVAAKGKSQPVPAYRVASVLPSAEAIPRRPDLPIVGRRDELRLLRDALAETRAGSARLVTVEGDAGIGKSRLVAELAATPGVVVLRGRCLPYGESSSLGPVADVVRVAALIGSGSGRSAAAKRVSGLLGSADDADAIGARLMAVLGLTDEAYPIEELFWAVRRCVEEAARARPAVVVVEDVHWAQPTTLALLSHLAANVAASVLIVCTTRPDLRESNPEWPGEVPDAVSLRLGPLGEDHAEELVERLLGREVPDDMKRRVAAAAEGNPLFAEQLVWMLVDEGLLERRDGRWRATGSLVQLAVPPSIASLLAARIDRLAPSERTVLERASVVGLSFALEAVTKLCTDALRPMLPEALGSLVSKDFLVSEGADSYRFGHALIREAAYAGILKRTRAELHERFARWLKRTTSEASLEREELVATHLEQAYRSLVSLGQVSTKALALASEAAGQFHGAGMRALARSDPSSAVDLLSRASDLAPEDLQIRLVLAEAHDETGESDAAWALVTDVKQQAEAAGDRRIAAYAEVLAVYHESERNPASDGLALLRRAERATSVLEEIGTDRDRSVAWFQMSEALMAAGRNSDADAGYGKAIEFAARGSDEWQEGMQRAVRVMNAAWGATPVPEAIVMAEETLAWADGMPSIEGRLLRTLGQLKVMDGRADEGGEDFHRSRAVFERLAMPGSMLATLVAMGDASLLLGRARDAEQTLREALSIAERGGRFVEQVRLVLARTVIEQGRAEEAAALLEGTERVSEGWDAQSRIWIRSTPARVCAALGELDRAQQAAREGVKIAEATELLNDQAEAWVALGEVLSVAGRKAEALEAFREALARYERKGNVAGVEGVRARWHVSPRPVPRAPAAPPGR
jgi:class 3 adenylate cyclase/tetratricopeptide (TPR) repeat protein